jgi:lysyl-tRNA synthetase class 2
MGHAGTPFYLSTSPEFAMKRLLAAGSGDIYQICKAFRDGERGRWHNPEFTMLEWYRVGFDDSRLMDDVEELVKRLFEPYRSIADAERLTYADALRRHAGIDSESASETELAKVARELGISIGGEMSRDVRLDLLMGMIVGPRLGWERPAFVCDYPASQASLARIKPSDSDDGRTPVAARFELYIDGLEIANGFHELADASEQKRRFSADLDSRRSAGKATPPMDERLLDALAAGMPDCAGVALGFDRLAALAVGADDIRSVLSFDGERA